LLPWEKHCQLRRSRGWQCPFRRVTIWSITLSTICYLIYCTECFHFLVCNDVFFYFNVFFHFNVFFFILMFQFIHNHQIEALNERVAVNKIVTRWAMCQSRMLPSSYPKKLQLTYMKYNKPDCLPGNDYVAQGWHILSRVDNPSYHTLTQCHSYFV
jgi:hypothetical protein